MLLLKNKPERVFNLYNQYAKEIQDIQDINDWCKHKTVTDKVLNPQTSENEKVLAAIGDKHVQEGDKVDLFYLDKENMALVENFDDEYYEDMYFKKLHDSISLFENVLDTRLFPNYKNSTNKDLL